MKKSWICLKLVLETLWEESLTPVWFWLSFCHLSSSISRRFKCRETTCKGLHGAFALARSTSGVVFQDSEKAVEWMLTHTHSHTRLHTHTDGSSLLPSQTSKLAVPWGTSNAGEAIKRQKLFSVTSWFIWLKNETTNPTDIIFPSQGLLYQAQTKLLPGGNPLKSRKGSAWRVVAFLLALVFRLLLWLHIFFFPSLLCLSISL